MEQSTNTTSWSPSLATPLWRAKDVGKYFGLSPKAVYQLVDAAGLPCIRIGSRLRFEPEEVRRWLTARRNREGGVLSHHVINASGGEQK